MAARKDGATLALFLPIATLLSAVFWTPMVGAGHVGAGGGHYVEGLMWSPAVAAYLTIKLRRLDIDSLGLSSIGGKWAVVGYATPPIYAAIAYGLVWALGFGFFPDPAGIAKLAKPLDWRPLAATTFVSRYFLLIGTTGIIAGTARALGEEIGWRGFLAPHLVDRMGFTCGAIVTGAIWTAWHVPILLYADYNKGAPWWFSLCCFTLMVVGLSVILTWLRLRSNSVWPCAILHGSHNLFIEKFFTPLTGPTGRFTPYEIDEFGLAVPVVVLAFAIMFWRFRDRAVS